MELRSNYKFKSGISSYLDVDFNDKGDLCFSGQDVGIPNDLQLGFDDDYEYWKTIRANQIPALRKILNIPENEDILEFLETHYKDEKSLELEEILNEAEKDELINIEFFSY